MEVYESHPWLAASSSTLPSADPKMWSGSYLAQLEAADEVRAARWEDVDMEAAEYIANHQEYEQPEMRTPTRSQAVGTVSLSHVGRKVSIGRADKSRAHTDTSLSIRMYSSIISTLFRVSLRYFPSIRDNIN